MSEKELEIFELCERLTELLGDKEAIADLKRLYEKHPEMFKDMQEVSQTIKEVVSEADLIIKNPNARSEKDYIAVKKNLSFNQKKMGDVGIRNSDGTNIAFHANKQDERNFNRFLNKAANGEAVRSLHTPSQAWMGGNEKSSGANALSSTARDIIAQNDNKRLQNTQKEPNKESQIKSMQEAVKKASLKLGLGENSKNNTSIGLNKPQNINFNKGER